MCVNVWLEEEDASEFACASKSADDRGAAENDSLMKANEEREWA